MEATTIRTAVSPRPLYSQHHKVLVYFILAHIGFRALAIYNNGSPGDYAIYLLPNQWGGMMAQSNEAKRKLEEANWEQLCDENTSISTKELDK